MQTGPGRRGFLPADSNSVSSRPRIPAALSGGRAGSQLSTFFGRKYDSPERLRRSLDPGAPGAARAILRRVAGAAAVNGRFRGAARRFRPRSRIEGGQARRIVVPHTEETR